MSKLLLLSNSTMPGTPFFTWPRAHVKEFLGTGDHRICFIPFAGVKIGFDDYEQAVAGAFQEMGYRVTSIHRVDDKAELIKSASCIVVGGGNTFALLSRMYEHGLIEVVKTRISTGTPYLGWSA